MDTTEILLTVLVGLVVVRIIQAELAHRALLRLLGDLATMLGDWYDSLTGD